MNMALNTKNVDLMDKGLETYSVIFLLLYYALNETDANVTKYLSFEESYWRTLSMNQCGNENFVSRHPQKNDLI